MSIEQPVTVEEQNYAAVSMRITELNVKIDAAKEAMARYSFTHPLQTASVREELIRQRGELELLEAQLQELLPVWSNLKWRVNGW
jgi:hypothetical protein